MVSLRADVNDVVDTSQALLIQQASAIIAADLENLSRCIGTSSLGI